jgi:succinate-semialdehyde dehydrogenase/glutarate-semialdehyde dehydrogenase
LIKTQGFIDGKWVDSKDGAKITVTSKQRPLVSYRIYLSTSVDPANNKELGTVPEMGLAETKEAIDAAAKAFKTWGKTTAKVSKFSG